MFHLGFSGIGEMILAAPPEARAFDPFLCRFPAGSVILSKKSPALGGTPSRCMMGRGYLLRWSVL